ncbi:hypothetical protein [Carboxydothermus ferrireducens]|uniref:Uncharacterized protein n=1 Tax=Carboxydothermus ferrireducens DSM 11255 TaxID=1119529 RepID=A0ABX2R975_9THEO|nr:hypothetical protein [Carboxydothermus ferrireducens]NYE56412.1 hypothetical protein [Carboxydothermus ferrireducens DSM 11255]
MEKFTDKILWGLAGLIAALYVTDNDFLFLGTPKIIALAKTILITYLPSLILLTLVASLLVNRFNLHPLLVLLMYGAPSFLRLNGFISLIVAKILPFALKISPLLKPELAKRALVKGITLAAVTAVGIVWSNYDKKRKKSRR